MKKISLRVFLFGLLLSYLLSPLSTFGGYFVSKDNEVGYISNQVYTSILDFNPQDKYFISYYKDDITGREYIGYSLDTNFFNYKSYYLYDVESTVTYTIYDGNYYYNGMRGDRGFVYNGYFYGSSYLNNDNRSSLVKTDISTGVKTEVFIYGSYNVSVESAFKSEKYKRYYFVAGYADSGFLYSISPESGEVSYVAVNLGHILSGSPGLPNPDTIQLFVYNWSYFNSYFDILTASRITTDLIFDEDYIFLTQNGYTFLSEYPDEVALTPAPTPTNLTQQLEMPDPEDSEGDHNYKLAREEIGSGTELGYKIGHFQSGSGIILSAYVDNQTSKEIKLQFTLTNGSGQTLPPYTSTGFITGTGEVTIPDLPAGDYTWKVKTIGAGLTDSAEMIHIHDITNPDFAIFYGFEPYPYGYKFENNSPYVRESYCVLDPVGCLLESNLLNGGFSTGWLDGKRYKNDGNKWEIFNKVFPENTFASQDKMFDYFEQLGMNNYLNTPFNGGSCFGISLTSVLQYNKSSFLNVEYPDFHDLVGNGYLWNTTSVSTYAGLWNKYNTTLKTVFPADLYQYTDSFYIADKKSKTGTGILQEISENPGKYVLNIHMNKVDENGKVKVDENGKETKGFHHAVVPYKVEGNKVYVYDSNYSYQQLLSKAAYKQYIQINSDGTWFSPIYANRGYNDFYKISLVKAEDVTTPVSYDILGYNGDSLVTIGGDSDILVYDALGRYSGFLNGKTYENAPGIDVFEPVTESLNSSGSNLRHIYIPAKKDGLTIKVFGKSNEKYTLMIAGGDYYQKLEGVTTSSGQTDTFTTTGTGLTINFDDAKTGTYSLLMDNFHDYGVTNNGTGTVYIDSANVTPQSQQYSIDWDKVVQNTNDATQHTVDTNNDGTIGNTGDITTNLPPIYQDITPPTTTATLTGTLVPNSTGSYYDTATITLNAVDTTNGSGVDKTYYSINTGSILSYTGSITLTNTGTTTKNYTLNYYSVDKFNNTEPIQTIPFSITKTQPSTPTYTFPTQTISWNSGQQTAISGRYTVVGNVSGYTRGQNIPFTTGGQGNPTVQTTNGNRATSGNFQGGLNIQMNVPPRGETYTGYVDIQGLRLIFSTKRDPAPLSDVGALDFGTKTVNYGGTVVSNRVTFPFLPDPTPFTITGSGNPTVQTSNGTRSNTGTVSYGTNIQAEIPAVGQTRVIEFTILGKTGKFTIKRQ